MVIRREAGQGDEIIEQGLGIFGSRLVVEPGGAIERFGDEQYALFDRLAELTRVPDATFADLTAAYTDDPRLQVPPTIYNAVLNRAESVLD